MANQTTNLPPAVQKALDVLVLSLLNAEPIKAYGHAQARLEADPEAQDIIERLSAAQADLRVSQSRNAVLPADVDKVRALQGKARSNRIIMEWAEAQQAANAYLPEVNQEISALLGVDFAAFARSNCCG